MQPLVLYDRAVARHDPRFARDRHIGGACACRALVPSGLDLVAFDGQVQCVGWKRGPVEGQLPRCRTEMVSVQLRRREISTRVGTFAGRDGG
jgi:hypothetical protein